MCFFSLSLSSGSIFTFIDRLLRMIASRVRDEVDNSSTGQQRKAGISGAELGYNNTNLKTVAVLPVSRNVPVEAFAKKLQAALEGIGASTAYLNQAIIANHLGRHAFTRMGKLKVLVPFDRFLKVILLTMIQILVCWLACRSRTKVSYCSLRSRLARQ